MALQVLFSYLTYGISSALTARWFLSFRRKITESQTSQPFDTTLGYTDWRISLPRTRPARNNTESMWDVAPMSEDKPDLEIQRQQGKTMPTIPEDKFDETSSPEVVTKPEACHVGGQP